MQPCSLEEGNFPNKIVDKFRFIHFFVFFFNICLFYFVFLQTKL